MFLFIEVEKQKTQIRKDTTKVEDNHTYVRHSWDNKMQLEINSQLVH